MSIDRFGDASEAHRRAVARRMAEVVADVRQDAFELEKTSTDDNQKVATDVLVEWERLELVRAEGDEEPIIWESVRKELIAWVQALNAMHAILEEQYDRMVEQGNDEVFERIAKAVELWDAELVLRPDDRMREFTRSSLPLALVHNPEVAKLQLLAPDDAEEEVDEGGEIGDSDEDEESGSEGDDDDIRSESEEHDDPSEEEDDEDEDESAKKQKCEA